MRLWPLRPTARGLAAQPEVATGRNQLFSMREEAVISQVVHATHHTHPFQCSHRAQPTGPYALNQVHHMAQLCSEGQPAASIGLMLIGNLIHSPTRAHQPFPILFPHFF